MKKIMLMMFVVVLLVGTINAFEIDNVQSYDEDKREYLIENAFGLGKDIARVKLNSELVESLNVGYRKVAEFNVENYDDYVNVFNVMEFSDLNNNSKSFTRDFDYKQKTIIQIPNIENVCNDFLSANGTLHQDCNLIEKGTKDKIIWEEINKVGGLLKGNFTIGIFTEVKKRDKVEWIPTLFGERLTEWAIWEDGGLKVGLVSYYRLDETYANNTVVDALANNSGNNSGGSRGVSGIIVNAFEYNGTRRNQTNFSTNFGFGLINNTVNFWINPANLSQRGLFVNIGSHDSTFNGFGVGIGDTTADNVGDNLIGIFGGVGWFDSDVVISPGWSMVTMIMNGTKDMHFYLNGTSVGNSTGINPTAPESNTTIGGAPGGTNRYFDGRIDELGFWNRTLTGSEIIELYASGFGCTYEDEVCGPVPTATLNSPINAFNTTNQTVDFNGTVVGIEGVVNVTLFIDGVKNETNSSGINDTDYLFTKTIEDGDHNWTYTTCNANGCTTASTRIFTIDKSNPLIIVTFPNETIDFHEININLSVNWTVSDINLDTCTLEYEGVNTTVTCLDNNTNINVTTSLNRSLIFYVNDTLGNTNSSSVSWNYKIFQNSINFSATTLGGTTEAFTLNITKISSLQISTVDLVYNLSASASSFTSGDTLIISRNIDVPNPTANFNFTFYFSFLMSDSSIINTTSNNQTVLNLAIGNCSTFSTLIYNFTMFDEENLTKLDNVTIDYAFNLFDDSRKTKIDNFSRASTANPTQVCINQNLTASSSYSLDAILQFESSDATGYLTRFYNILNFTLKNSTIPNNISLYDVVDDTATPFQLTFKNEFLALAPNILVNVNKQFVASNDFKTVEIPITDTNGQTILNLERNVGIYNFIFIDIAGNIVATFNKITAFCQDFTIGECTLELDATGTLPRLFNLTNSTAISYVLTYKNSTSTATLTFNSLDSTPVTARIIGTTQNQFGNQSVCDRSLTTTLGTVDCNVTSILLTDNYLFLDIFSNGNFVETRVININPSIPLLGGIFGASGFFIAFLMMLTIILLFSNDRQVLLIMLGLGWATIIILGLVKGAIIGSLSGGIWLIITIAIMLWKLKEEEKGI